MISSYLFLFYKLFSSFQSMHKLLFLLPALPPFLSDLLTINLLCFTQTPYIFFTLLLVHVTLLGQRYGIFQGMKTKSYSNFKLIASFWDRK